MREPTIAVRDGKPMVCVKDTARYHPSADLDEIGEAAGGEIYEGLQEDFWRHFAPSVARSYGYRGVFSDGRSEGWLYADGVPDFLEYLDADDPFSNDDAMLAEASEVGESDFQEVALAIQRRDDFLRFARAIVAEIDYLREDFMREVGGEAERVRREPALAADARCRDIETVG